MVSSFIAFVRSCCYVVLEFFIVRFKSMEPLSFDSPVVRRTVFYYIITNGIFKIED